MIFFPFIKLSKEEEWSPDSNTENINQEKVDSEAVNRMEEGRSLDPAEILFLDPSLWRNW